MEAKLTGHKVKVFFLCVLIWSPVFLSSSCFNSPVLWIISVLNQTEPLLLSPGGFPIELVLFE